MTQKTTTEVPSVARNVICESEQMQAVYRYVDQVAPTKATVLITGETGVGKEIIAQAIHESSPRKEGPFKIVNCGGIPTELIQSELFGHERGAFTSAIREHRGVFEQADRGTLFLDEVGEMPLEAQAHFLRVLEKQEFSPIGAEKTIKVDVRVIAATNLNLKTSVTQKKFREDLYYRLNLFRIQVPPLRNRRSDIPNLASGLVSRLSKEHDKSITGIAPAAINHLQSVDWPGNVRELRNAIETAIILTENTELRIDDVKLALAILNESDENWDTNSGVLRDSISVKLEDSDEPDDLLDPPLADPKNGLWKLVRNGTISEITSHVTLIRYETEIPHRPKKDIAKDLKISVPTLDKYCEYAKKSSRER